MLLHHFVSIEFPPNMYIDMFLVSASFLLTFEYASIDYIILNTRYLFSFSWSQLIYTKWVYSSSTSFHLNYHNPFILQYFVLFLICTFHNVLCVVLYYILDKLLLYFMILLCGGIPFGTELAIFDYDITSLYWSFLHYFLHIISTWYIFICNPSFARK